QAQSRRRRPDLVIAAAVHSRLHLAVARHRRYGTDRGAGAIDLLVRIADAADVSGAAGATQKRHGLLAGARPVLPADHGALRRDGVDARQARHFALGMAINARSATARAMTLWAG